MDLETFMETVERRHPGDAVFHQAVREVAEDVIPLLDDQPEYRDARILERITEPDRIIVFRVCWADCDGQVQINRGYRVQWSGALGPYKGGLRFAPELRLATLKFLGFEQTLKSALTTLPMGGAKGGADFDPHGRSDLEIMRFCQAFMTELYRHIGPDVDVPAGDIGVGSREIGYLFGQYRRLTNRFHGVLTGKDVEFGGSQVRTEATGWGCVYFAKEMLEHAGRSLEGLRCVVSGAGNVALYTAQKLLDEGAVVVSLSDSDGAVHAPKGINGDQVEWQIQEKEAGRGRLKVFAKEFGFEYLEGEKPWALPCDAAFPCAVENEIEEADARALIEGGCGLVAEGANMPATSRAARLFRDQGILYAPAKAANAGGVAISGLEMTQNSLRLTWDRERVDGELRSIMKSIHAACVEHGGGSGSLDYVRGANRAAFLKVALVLKSYGVV